MEELIIPDLLDDEYISELLDDLRKFSYGRSRRQLDQISNFLGIMQLIQVMNHSDQEEGEQNEPGMAE